MSDNSTKKCKYCQSDISKKAKICPVCKKKQKHSALGIILISLIIITLIGACSSTPSSETGNDTLSSEPNKITSNNAPSVTPAKSEKKLTPDKFNAIDFGMTYEEVVELIGEEGTNLSESTVMDIVTAIYQWDEGLNNFNITLQDNAVIGKAQFGIVSISDADITLEMYNSIKSGMTYEEVVTVFGSKGALLSTAKTMDSITTIYTWDGTSLGGNCNVTFYDGEVLSKAQYGLE